MGRCISILLYLLAAGIPAMSQTLLVPRCMPFGTSQVCGRCGIELCSCCPHGGARESTCMKSSRASWSRFRASCMQHKRLLGIVIPCLLDSAITPCHLSLIRSLTATTHPLALPTPSELSSFPPIRSFIASFISSRSLSTIGFSPTRCPTTSFRPCSNRKTRQAPIFGCCCKGVRTKPAS